jgi:hypothetical protein
VNNKDQLLDVVGASSVANSADSVAAASVGSSVASDTGSSVTSCVGSSVNVGRTVGLAVGDSAGVGVLLNNGVSVGPIVGRVYGNSRVGAGVPACRSEAHDSDPKTTTSSRTWIFFMGRYFNA